MFRVEMDCGNAAFDSESGDEALGVLMRDAEVSRILRVVADRVSRGEYEGTLRDINGNQVGFFRFKEEI